LLQLDSEIKLKLGRCVEIFPQIGIECIGAFAGVSCRLIEPWELNERMPGNFKHNIILGAGSNLYQTSFGIGFKNDTDMQLIRSETFEELCDAWGELANTYCGMLMDSEKFTNEFGVLTQSNPQYSGGHIFFPKAWAFSGALVSDKNESINFGYAIRKLTF
jgi:hypothetical protein